MEENKEITPVPPNEIEKKEEQPKDIANLVSDERLLGIYGEILSTIKEDRQELNETINNFKNLL